MGPIKNLFFFSHPVCTMHAFISYRFNPLCGVQHLLLDGALKDDDDDDIPEKLLFPESSSSSKTTSSTSLIADAAAKALIDAKSLVDINLFADVPSPMLNGGEF